MSVSKWHIKALVQKTISFLPFHESVNYYFQKKITKAVVLDDVHFGYKIGHASDHVAYFKKHGKPDKDSSIVELGTGWFPIVTEILLFVSIFPVLGVLATSSPSR